MKESGEGGRFGRGKVKEGMVSLYYNLKNKSITPQKKQSLNNNSKTE